MTTERKVSARSGGVWPGIIAPLGLTALVGVAATFFVAKIMADQERIDADTVRHEQYARLEAEEIATRSRNLAQAYVAARLAKHQALRESLRKEARGVMDAVHRFLTASLEKSKAGSVARREVGDFPAGFEGVKNYLELSAQKTREDRHVVALRASSPELAALLPSGCSLAVIEDNSHEILSLGGGTVPENAVSEAMTRDFFWEDGGRGRNWTLQVRIRSADEFPVPEAGDIARHLAEKLEDVRLDGVDWRGWLVDTAGQAIASFPVPADGAATDQDSATPYVSVARYWTAVDDERIVWMEQAMPIPGQDLTPAVSVAIRRPAPPLDIIVEFWNDGKWSATLGGLALLSLAVWIWFLRTVFAARTVPAPAKAPKEAAPPLQRQTPKKRLVRDASRARAVPDVQDVIVADIDDDGEVTVEAVPHLASPHKPPIPIPSGSLFRLQAIHRGGKGMKGSRVLDQARSQLLKELASRVRPVVDGVVFDDDEERRRSAAAKASQIISAMKSPGGWDKVG